MTTAIETGSEHGKEYISLSDNQQHISDILDVKAERSFLPLNRREFLKAACAAALATSSVLYALKKVLQDDRHTVFTGGLYQNQEQYYEPNTMMIGTQRLAPGPLVNLRDPETNDEYAVGCSAGLHTCGIPQDKMSSEICKASGGDFFFYTKNKKGEWRLRTDMYFACKYLGTSSARAVIACIPENDLPKLKRALPNDTGNHDCRRILAILDELYTVQNTDSRAAQELYGKLVTAVLSDLIAAMEKNRDVRGVWKTSNQLPKKGGPYETPITPLIQLPTL